MRRLCINQRTLINRQDANQERPASRSIAVWFHPKPFRSSLPQMEIRRRAILNARLYNVYPVSPWWALRVYVCARTYGRLQRTVQQQGYPPPALADAFVFRDRETFL